MSSLLPSLLSFLLVYKYAVVFIISFLSSLGIPVPAAPTAIAASAFAGQGYLNVFWVMLSGIAGNILGDITMYWLVRGFGRRVLFWLRLGKAAESTDVRNVLATADSNKTWVIIASRFQDQATTLVNIIAGLGKINFKRFALLAATGDVLQMAFYVFIGYFFSDDWQAVYGAVGQFSWIIALALAIFFIMAANKIFNRKLNPDKK